MISTDFLISSGSLLKILQSKPTRRLLEAILYEADCYGVVYNLTVTNFTKKLHYKNKSTVSRVFKFLREIEFIIPINKNTYQLNNFLLPQSI